MKFFSFWQSGACLTQWFGYIPILCAVWIRPSVGWWLTSSGLLGQLLVLIVASMAECLICLERVCFWISKQPYSSPVRIMGCFGHKSFKESSYWIWTWATPGTVCFTRSITLLATTYTERNYRLALKSAGFLLTIQTARSYFLEIDGYYYYYYYYHKCT